MADIELVIKIPKAEYDLIVNDEACGLNVLTRAIAHGTPLPKGHGRLIDADALHHKMGEWLKPQTPDESVMVALDDIAVSTMIEIEEAPTIIEADKGSEGYE